MVIVSVGYDFGVHKIFVLCFYLFTMYFTVAAVCVGMIYRYFAVCRYESSFSELHSLVLTRFRKTTVSGSQPCATGP